jgi:hypothetical protein
MSELLERLRKNKVKLTSAQKNDLKAAADKKKIKLPENLKKAQKERILRRKQKDPSAGIVAQLLDDVNEVYVEHDFIYLPVLTDEDMMSNIKNSKEIRKIERRYFIKGFNIRHIINSFSMLYPECYGFIKKETLKATMPDVSYDDLKKSVKLDSRLEMIVFQVGKRFIEPEKRMQKTIKETTEKDVLALINSRIDIPKEYLKRAEQAMKYPKISGLVKRIKMPKMSFNAGLIGIGELEEELKSRLKTKIIQDEQIDIEKNIKNFMEKDIGSLAVLFYLQDKGSLDLGNFGFYKSHESYVVYISVGQYALRDYTQPENVFLMAPFKMSVRVSQYEISEPSTLSTYHHPFMHSGTLICILGGAPKHRLTADSIIHNLELGTNTLLYGYRSGIDHPGYGSLSRGHYRKISENDQRIKNDEIIITNDPFVKRRK